MRRQTAAHAGERELQVLDYQNTAADLLPLLAQAYALLFMVRFTCPLPSPFTGMAIHVYADDRTLGCREQASPSERGQHRFSEAHDTEKGFQGAVWCVLIQESAM